MARTCEERSHWSHPRRLRLERGIAPLRLALRMKLHCGDAFSFYLLSVQHTDFYSLQLAQASLWHHSSNAQCILLRGVHTRPEARDPVEWAT